MFIKDGKGFVPGITEKYIPTLERFDDRTDVKWAHPELTDVYDLAGAESQHITSLLNDPGISREERIKRRDGSVEMARQLIPGIDTDIFDKEVRTISGLKENDPDIDIFIIKPKNSKRKKIPVLFAVGEGGMIMNAFDLMGALMLPNILRLDVALVFPCARSAADAYYPAPIDDYQASYQWVLDSGADLDLDHDNIVLYGESGGGFTVLSFAFRCKRVGFKPKGCMAREPIVDDRMVYPSSRIVTGGWDGQDVLRTFKMLTKDADQFSPFMGPEVVPNHATVEDCKGLCPIYLHAMEMDPDRDPIIDFYNKLLEAKVFCQLHVWAGAVHSSFAVPSAQKSLTKDAYEAICDAEMHDMFTYDLRRQWLSEEK